MVSSEYNRNLKKKLARKCTKIFKKCQSVANGARQDRNILLWGAIHVYVTCFEYMSFSLLVVEILVAICFIMHPAGALSFPCRKTGTKNSSFQFPEFFAKSLDF